MGGKAFQGVTRRILVDEIPSTLSWLTENWRGSSAQGGDYKDHLLGSAGKNPTSGDLDLNLDINKFNQEEVARELIDLLGGQYVKVRSGNNQIFTAVPIGGDAEKNGRVQVDFMFGDYEWQKFSYHSPFLIVPNANKASTPSYDRSHLKGLYRTELLKALVAFNSDWVLMEGSEVIARVGPTFFHDRGLVWRYRYRPWRRDSVKRVQDFREVSKEEFLELFPSALVAHQESTLDPEEVRSLILGDMPMWYCNSFEYLCMAIKMVYRPHEIITISAIYLERLNSLKVEIPIRTFKIHGLRF